MDTYTEHSDDYVPSGSGLLLLAHGPEGRQASHGGGLLTKETLCGFVAELPSRRWLKQSLRLRTPVG